MKKIILISIILGLTTIIVAICYSNEIFAKIGNNVDLTQVPFCVFVMNDKDELVTIDTRTDKVVRTTSLEESVTNPTLDPDGEYLYLTSGKPFLSPFGEYFIVYNIKTNNVIKKIKMPFPAPADIGIVNINGQKKIFITSRDYGKDYGAGITILSSDFNIIDKYHLKEPSETLDYTLIPSVNNTRLFGLSNRFNHLPLEKMGSITLRVIDSDTGHIIKNIPIPEGWGANDITDTYEGKLYIATQTRKYTNGVEVAVMSNKEKANLFTTELLVYSNKDYKLLKTVPISRIPSMMAYFPKQHKLFVEHDNNFNEWGFDTEIEIIDTQTDKIVGSIKNVYTTVGIFRVSENKLYMVVHGEEEGIKVWDVDKNKFTGFIQGNFGGGISSYPLQPITNKIN